jgi:hypothetical protein
MLHPAPIEASEPAIVLQHDPADSCETDPETTLEPFLDPILGQELKQIAWLLSISAPEPPAYLKQRILAQIDHPKSTSNF